MAISDEYRLIINEAQRRLLLRAVTAAMENARRSSEDLLSRPTEKEFLELVVRLGSLEPRRPKR